MDFTYAELITNQLGLGHIIESKVIQDVWSGYGKIIRIQLDHEERPSVILKEINLQSNDKHPRGWNTERSHLRKVKSYEVEQEWYAKWADQCNTNCRVPKCYCSINEGGQKLILLEDLDTSGYPKRRESLEINEAKIVLKWLANFHARFMNHSPVGLWEQGSYWHLSTRPDELEAMEECKLKKQAKAIDDLLQNCTFQTLIHGDAKVANFCFSADMTEVAAVDFQYVGGGCGMKDVAYFLGSCLTEEQCFNHEVELLNAYFDYLSSALSDGSLEIDCIALEKEWRKLFPIAWADFTRFLLGWSSSHKKINDYSKHMVVEALNQL